MYKVADHFNAFDELRENKISINVESSLIITIEPHDHFKVFHMKTQYSILMHPQKSTYEVAHIRIKYILSLILV